jgi:hypothetical protein
VLAYHNNKLSCACTESFLNIGITIENFTRRKLIYSVYFLKKIVIKENKHEERNRGKQGFRGNRENRD